MKPRKIPERSCIVTKEKLPKKEVLRIVKTNDGQVFVDQSGKANGRGAYLKKDLTVLEKAMKNKVLEKHLETPIPDELYEEIKKIIIP